MAELTQTELESKIADIDTALAAIVTGISGASTAAGFVDYTIGNKSISASQRSKQLMEMREMYQTMLNSLPKETTDVATYDVRRDGADESDLEGDQ